MVQFVGKLTALKVMRVRQPGLYADGGGLYLQVTGDGDKRGNLHYLFLTGATARSQQTCERQRRA
jgi:hypothetical protein